MKIEKAVGKIAHAILLGMTIPNKKIIPAEIRSVL